MPIHLRRVVLSLVLLLIAGMAFWAPGVSTAQGNKTTCAQLLSNVAQHLSQGCQTMNRDEVCYGNRNITVEYTSEAGQAALNKEGDTAPLNIIKSLKAGPLNPDSGEWGVAVIKAQTTNLEGVTGGQAVTFIVYGDTTLGGQAETIGANSQPPAAVSCTGTTSRTTFLRANPGPNEPQVRLLQPGTAATFSGRTAVGNWLYGESQGQKGWLFKDVLKLDCDPATLPVADPAVATLPGVNAFYFTSGVGAQSSCTDIPPAGLFVQSPKGLTVTFKLNGADIVMGSTGVFTFTPGQSNQITIWTIDGDIGAVVGGTLFNVPAGHARSFPLSTEGLRLANPPGAPRLISLTNPLAAAYIRTLCGVARATGLTVQGCNVRTASTPKPGTPVSTQKVCEPTQPGLPCNCNGACDAGESYYTCPQDCPFAPIQPPGATPACIAPGNTCILAGGPPCCSGLKCRAITRTTGVCP